MGKRGKFEKAPKEKKGKRGKTALLITGLVLLLLIIGAAVWGFSLKGSGKIYPNVHIAGVDVGGMERLEAVEALEEAAAQAYSAILTVKLPDRTLTFNPEQTGVALNVEDTVDEAIRHGRRGGPFGAIGQYLKAAGQRYDMELQTALELDTEYIRQMIGQVAEEVEQKLTQPEVHYDREAETIRFKLGTDYRSLDTEGLYNAVCQAYMDGDFSQLNWEYEETPCQKLDLQPYYEVYCTPVQDAVLDLEEKIYTEAAEGFGFDPEEVEKELALLPEGGELTVPMGPLMPKVTNEEISAEHFSTKLHAVSSPYYASNVKRTNNLKLACEALNGTVLFPGDVFSFNEIVGERTEEKGYQAATVYAEGGASTDEVGGGICQVASTIYYCTLFMDVEQVQREPHMYAVTYVPMGMDAAIYWGIGQDYKFKNTFTTPIKLQAYLDGSRVQIAFWGVPEQETKVEMTYEILETYPYETVEEVDETKPEGFREEKHSPYTGYKVVTYRAVYDKDGTLLSKKEEAYSTYKKRDHTFIVGPSAEEEPPEEMPLPEETLPPPEEEEPENEGFYPWETDEDESNDQADNATDWT